MHNSLHPRAESRSQRCQRGQRGTSVLEALVAFLVLAIGMLTVARIQAPMRLNSELARQRSEAVRLGQDDLETLRSFSVMQAASGVRSYADASNDLRSIDTAAGYASTTRYQLSRLINASSAALGARAKDAAVTVSWQDRSGAEQQIVLHSIIAGSDPSLTGALRIGHRNTPVNGALARSARIPLGAKDLGGRSAFKPVSDGSVALLFDNQSGLVIGRCTDVPAATATRDLSSADLVSCDANVGLLLSGAVRFTSASPPDPSVAAEAPLATTVALALRGGTYPTAPVCASEAMKTVTYTSRASRQIDAVPLGARPADVGVGAWHDPGWRHLAYTCVVYPRLDGKWSGRVTLLPSGWSLGPRAADRRVCRFSADLDGSGAVDANIEHPPIYTDVQASLAHQNFLVVNGTDACPSVAAGQVAVGLAYPGTVQHQP